MKKFILVICWSLFFSMTISTLSFGQSDKKNSAIFDTTMRFVRLRATLLDNSGNAVQMVQWDTKGTWKKLTETKFINKRLMFRDLLIPNAPWMQWYGDISIALDEKAPIELVGKEQFLPVKLPGQSGIKLIMWKATFTDNKWVGIDEDKVIERSEDGVGKQIGWLSFRNLTIDSGETLLLFMTKGMGKNDKWEGDAGDTVYREEKEGHGTPIGKLEFRSLKSEDGMETSILMTRLFSDNTKWFGTQNGKVVELK
jgi:hypothetical protein